MYVCVCVSFHYLFVCLSLPVVYCRLWSTFSLGSSTQHRTRVSAWQRNACTPTSSEFSQVSFDRWPTAAVASTMLCCSQSCTVSVCIHCLYIWQVQGWKPRASFAHSCSHFCLTLLLASIFLFVLFFPSLGSLCWYALNLVLYIWL